MKELKFCESSIKCDIDPKEKNFTPINYELLLETIADYDIVSFDVFDTLIFRPFTSPRVLFLMMEEKLSIYRFAQIRLESEDEICAENLEKYGNGTSTIEEIYERIGEKTNKSIKNAAVLEFQLELKYCFANPVFTKIFEQCKRLGKKIIITSDIYFSLEQISHLLSKNGYSGFETVFVSSCFHKTKRKGDLFDVVRSRYPSSKIFHIGDQEFEYINSQKAGFGAFHYISPNSVGSKNRFEDMSYITGRTYSAIVNTHLYTSAQTFSDPYKLGFIYGGIYILGFVQWISMFVKDRNVDKVLFLSRDGDIFSKMYKLLPNSGECEYFYWSRFAGVKITARDNYYEFCNRMIRHKARGVYSIRIKHFLKFYRLEVLEQFLPDYSLSQNDILNSVTAPRFEKLCYQHKSDVLSSFDSDIEATVNQVRKSVGNAKSIAIVDVGWAGTGPFILKNIIQKDLGLNCKVYSLLAGYRQPVEEMASLYTMDNFTYSYLFSCNYNRDLLNKHETGHCHYPNLLLELFSQSCTPSFLGYEADGLHFDLEELPNYEIIKEINSGIAEFVRKFVNTFKDDEFILNISAYDAYLPFSELKDVWYQLAPILSKLVISRGSFYDQEMQSQESWFTFFSSSS